MFLLRIFFWVVILLFCVIIKRFMNDLYYTITPPLPSPTTALDYGTTGLLNKRSVSHLLSCLFKPDAK